MPTNDGVAAAGDFEPLPVGRELIRWWLAKLAAAPRTCLHSLVSQPGQSRTQLADRCNYSVTSGGYAGALAELNALGLIEKRGTLFYASADLMGG